MIIMIFQTWRKPSSESAGSQGHRRARCGCCTAFENGALKI